MPDRQQLTELQIAVLRLLWEQGELTVAQIWEQLYADRKLAQTTVATIVARLQRRRILSRRTKDRQFVYRALVTEADVQHSMVRELTERLFAGLESQHDRQHFFYRAGMAADLCHPQHRSSLTGVAARAPRPLVSRGFRAPVE